MKLLSALLLCMLFLFINTGCDRTNGPEDELISDDISQTDVVGEIIRDDIDDWQPRYIPVNNDTANQQSPVGIPVLFSVKPAYPNPVNILNNHQPVINFGYTLPSRAHVKLHISDADDNVIKELSNELQNAGYFSHRWNLQDSSNNIIPMGVYRLFIEAAADDSTFYSYGDIQLIE